MVRWAEGGLGKQGTTSTWASLQWRGSGSVLWRAAASGGEGEGLKSCLVADEGV
jgi:hypothetical protein